MKITLFIIKEKFSPKHPIRGWLHHCFLCDTLTTRTINLEYKNDTYYFYVCGNCKNEFNRRNYMIKKNVIVNITFTKIQIHYINKNLYR